MNTGKTVDNLRLPGEIRRFSVLCGDLLSGCEYSPTGQSLNLRDFPDSAETRSSFIRFVEQRLQTLQIEAETYGRANSTGQ